MKKILLSVIVFATALAGQATTTVEKSLTFNDVITTANAVHKASIGTTSNSNYYVAGMFDQVFTIKTEMAPIGVSSFIAYMDATTLTPAWNVAIEGAATITSLVVNPANNNVFVAGTLADEVIFNSVNGVSQTAEGMKMEGAYTTLQNASFIAEYTQEGNLVSVKSYIPSELQALVDTGMYFPYDGDIYLTIDNLNFVNGVLTASTTYTGQYTGVNGASLAATYMDAFGGGFYFAALRAASIVQFNSSLELSNVVYTLKSNNGVISEEQVRNINYTVSTEDANTYIYVGAVATGEENYTVGSTTGKVTFTTTETGDQGIGHIITKINAADNSLTTYKTWEYVTDQLFDINRISYMNVSGTNLIVAGTYLGSMPFNSSLTATGADDIYAAGLSTSDLSVNWSFTSEYNEGDLTKYEEIFTSAVLINETENPTLLLAGYTDTKSGHNLLNGIKYFINAETGAKGEFFEGTEVAYKVFPRTAGYVEVGSDLPGLTDFVIRNINYTSGVEGVLGNNNNVSVYPNPATEVLNFSEVCDVTISSLTGAVVAQDNNTTSINVSNLANGLYVARIATNGQISVVKFIKK